MTAAEQAATDNPVDTTTPEATESATVAGAGSDVVGDSVTTQSSSGELRQPELFGDPLPRVLDSPADPAPSPPPTPAPKAVVEEVAGPDPQDELRERLQQLEGRVAAAALRSRVSWARNHGLEALNDAELAAILPDVDPETKEGLAALDAWREGHPRLFPGSIIPSTPTVDDLLVNARPNKLWTKDVLRGIISSTMGD